ncbi:MAG: polysaccharide pyruvyl transferase family protein [Flavobacteriaceae bacterium]|nr:polysaccharide pyruvyl transferase family protein [Flavobacteriaceae bacterium]
MKNLIHSIKRSYHKRHSISTIKKAPISNTPVANIHRIDTSNAGDYYCAPHHYFDALKGTHLDIFSYKSIDKNRRQNFIDTVSQKSLIIGGGGLLNRNGFKRQMQLFESLASNGKKIVLWGIGHNDKHNMSNGINYNINTSQFALAGLRDYSKAEHYVPCVSCLHPIFDQPFTESQDIGIVFHKDTLKKENILSKFKSYPTASNIMKFEDIIDFIKLTNKIVTDSYHVMYWSMLLNKKVVVIPNSSKFFDFKYHPVISNFDDAISQLSKANAYTGILEECRTINHKFADKAFDYLNI